MVPAPTPRSIAFQDLQDRAKRAYLGRVLVQVVHPSDKAPYIISFGEWNDRALKNTVIQQMEKEFSSQDGCLSRRHPIPLCLSEMDIANSKEFLHNCSESSAIIPMLQLNPQRTGSAAILNIQAFSGHHRVTSARMAAKKLTERVEKAEAAWEGAERGGAGAADIEEYKAALDAAQNHLHAVCNWSADIYSDGAVTTALSHKSY